MAALYEQRREVLLASDDSEILGAFVEPAQEIPSKVGMVGRAWVLVRSAVPVIRRVRR